MPDKKRDWDSKQTDWTYWANLPSISAEDACWLICGVDPNICNNDQIERKYKLSDKKIIEIKKAIIQVNSDIQAGKEKKNNSPWIWICWAKNKGINVPEQFYKLVREAKVKSIRCYSYSQPLEEISPESMDWYMKQDSWTDSEAIFLMQGFKPLSEVNGSDEIRTHFPEVYQMLIRSINIGTVGKEISQAGQRGFIDTPANWITWAMDKLGNTEHIASLEYKQNLETEMDKHKETSKDETKQLKQENKNKRNQEWQTSLEVMADKLKIEGKRQQATKGYLASKLARETGANVATIERNTRKTW